jgi:hypothetical protein
MILANDQRNLKARINQESKKKKQEEKMYLGESENGTGSRQKAG